MRRGLNLFSSSIRHVALAMIFLMLGGNVAQALVTINSDTLWTNPAPLNDSLTITGTGILRIRAADGISGGNLIINLPSLGSFIIQNGGLLDLDGAIGTNSNSGNLTVNDLGNNTSINIAGVINAHGRGLGRGGIITLEADTYTLTSTGSIRARGGTTSNASGNGGAVYLRSGGPITLPNGFSIDTTGATTDTANLISIESVGVNLNGILLAEGAGTNQGGTVVLKSSGSGDVAIGSTGYISTIASPLPVSGKGGNIELTTVGTGNISINGGKLFANGRTGNDGGVISISATNNIEITGSSTRIQTRSDSSTSNAGNGGNINLAAGNDINITSSTSTQLLNANATATPSTFTANPSGHGGNIALNAGGNVTITTNSPYGSEALIEANGAPGVNPGQGGTVSVTANNLSIVNNVAQSKKTLISVKGGQGYQGVTTGTGGTISANLSGDLNLTNVMLNATAGTRYSGVATMSGNAGSINLIASGKATLTSTTLNADAYGSLGGGGLINLRANGGDLLFADTKSVLSNNTNRTGLISLYGNNITHKGLLYSWGGTQDGHGGTVNLTTGTGGTLNLQGAIYAGSAATVGAKGDGGNININAGNVNMTNNALLMAVGNYDAATNTRGAGGNINITATGAFVQDSTALIDSSGRPVTVSGNYTQNKINIQAASINTSGRIQASGRNGNDAGGYVSLKATSGDVVLNPTAVVSANADRWDMGINPGNGGRIDLNATTGNIQVSGYVVAKGSLGYNGGTINATAGQQLYLTNVGRLLVNSDNAARKGNGGIINISAGSVKIDSNSVATPMLSAEGNTNSAGASGNGGSVTIASTGAINIASTAGSTVVPVISVKAGGTTQSGAGGQIALNGNNITLTGSGAPRLMLGASSATGQAGNIQATAINTLAITDGIVQSSGTATGGIGGNVTLNAGTSMSLINTPINATSTTGKGGTITLGDAGSKALDTTSTLTTTGQTDSTHNKITLSGSSLTLNSLLNTSGLIGSGSSGGAVNLTSTGGNITLNNNITTNGYVFSTTQPANGGNVTINATGNYIQNGTSQINTSSIVQNSVQAQGGSNNGGAVQITASGTITLNQTGNPMVITDGANFNGGKNINGGNAGNISLESDTGIFMTATGGGWPTYAQAVGGNGEGNGYSGGNGGTLSLTSPSINIDRYRLDRNFNNSGGYGKKVTPGIQGLILLNGIPQ